MQTEFQEICFFEAHCDFHLTVLAEAKANATF